MTDLAGRAAEDKAECDVIDRRCLRGAAAGDRVAFEDLYRRYHPRLTRFLLCRTSHRDLIDDIVNDTLWIVWHSAADYRGESKVSTWIMGIAYRCMLKLLRNQAAPGQEVSEAVVSGFSMEEAPADSGFERRRELSNWVSKGLRLLPREQRETIELAYFMGESCDDIALIMGCPVGTVKARMFHARVRLRNLLPALGGLDELGDGPLGALSRAERA